MKLHPPRQVSWTLALGTACIVVACTGSTVEPEPQRAPGGDETPPQSWTFDPSMLFPADGSLLRPEDGVALPGGRLLVADQAAGLRLVGTDGRGEPFGTMPAAGYRHDPPEHSGYRLPPPPSEQPYRTFCGT